MLQLVAEGMISSMRCLMQAGKANDNYEIRANDEADKNPK
jgi:hypothetical protein